MGNPVIHFEVVGKDGEKLQSYYSELFDWKIDADNPMKYGLVDGAGIGGGIGTGPDGYDGHVTFYVEVADVEAALVKAEQLGGTRLMGPEKIETPGGEIEMGHFKDPEGQMVGVVK